MLNKSIFLSLLFIGVVVAAAGAGTWASFSDTETSTDNTLTAGTLYLDTDVFATSEAAVKASIGDVNPVCPGEEGTMKWTLINGGNMAGNLDIVLTDVTETAGDGTGAIGGNDVADLLTNDAMLRYEFGLDTNQDGDLWGADDVMLSTTSSPGPYLATTSDFPVVEMPAGASYDLVFKWVIPGGSGNEVQGDSLSFSFTANLDQI